MKKTISLTELAEMVILSTLIADNVLDIEAKFRNKKAKNRILEARKMILVKVADVKEKDNELYDETETFFDELYDFYISSDIINIARGFLGSYLRRYAFNDYLYNLFNKIYKNSINFASKREFSENEKIEFIKNIQKITKNQ